MIIRKLECNMQLRHPNIPYFFSLILGFLWLHIIPVSAQNIARTNVIGPDALTVNSYTGNLYYSRQDLFIPARGLAIDISFYYNSSLSTYNAGYGFGWTHSLQYVLCTR